MLSEILLEINNEWTLFLDRDGVINLELEDDYIRTPSAFFFLDHVPEAMSIFAGLFGEIFIVTNQKGVGKGLMTEDDLKDIHRYMSHEINHAGGRITRVYYCTSTEDDHPNRKPQPGMALQAKADYPQIDLSKSIMVGNTMSDMAFGRAAGMFTVFIQSSKPMPALPHPAIDAVFPSLYQLAKALQKPR
jgi:D-glycero-D-manno-heptose 1,7-bisphosphate phosphatase